MSHHFDTDQAKNDPRLNCCDVYVFQGRPGHTVLAMTSKADAGISSPDAFHPEGLYAERIDTDGEAKGVRVYAGVAPELWAADALAFFTTLTNLFSEDKYDPATFQNRQNLFQNRNVMAIVIEVPNAMLGTRKIGVWATISLFGHAPEVQICRWGYPLTTHLFLSNPSTPELTAKYHSSTPSDDAVTIGAAIGAFAARLSKRANPETNAEAHGKIVADMLCP